MFRALSRVSWKPFKERGSTIPLGLSSLPGCPYRENIFPYLQALLPLLSLPPTNMKAFSPELSLFPQASLPGFCLPKARLSFAPVLSFLPTALGPWAYCLVSPSLASSANLTVHLSHLTRSWIEMLNKTNPRAELVGHHMATSLEAD